MLMTRDRLISESRLSAGEFLGDALISHVDIVPTSRDQKSGKSLIDCIYLYRQFLSEAIRILLPVDIISDSN